MNKLKIGDKVKIKKSSQYYDQAPDIIGTIIADYGNEDFDWSVRFENGEENCYRENEDLKLVEERKPKEPDTLNIELGEKCKKLLSDNLKLLIEKGYLTEQLGLSVFGETQIEEALKSLIDRLKAEKEPIIHS